MDWKKIIALGLSSMVLVACSNNRSTETKQTFNQSLTQTVASGSLKGKEDSENKALEWLGIPYATAERWSAPKEVAKWRETYDATQYGEKALQFSNGEVTGSEEALNLDVVRPNTDETELPVIVFLHGGNNQTGHAQEIKGNTLVNDLNAVYVSVNYRLGPLGFNPLEALKTGNDEENSGNYTLLDIAAALDWVEENIESFGGDADNVTLTGFSAGGRDVMSTLISPLFKGKYDKAISFSGGMTLADTEESQAIFATAIAPLVVEDGIKATEEEAKNWLLTSDGEALEYLKSVSGDRLVALMGNAMIRMKAFPHLYKDGVVIPKEGFESKTYNDVPIMLITGTSEFSLFSAFDLRFAKDFSSGDLFKNTSQLAELTYAETYGSALYRLSNGVESARKMAANYKSDIFIGEIAYGDNAKVTPTLAASLGAFHGIFEPLLQQPSNYATFIGEDFNTEGAQDLAKQFKHYLKNFVRTGNPNEKSLTNWTAWTDKNNVLRLDADQKKAIIEDTVDAETAEDILKKMSEDTTLPSDLKQELDTTVLNGRWFSTVIDKK
ncbi:carboxylesterase family protein [Streptococcus sp. S784/96/1]|uniref:carboxylesterase family protein n=1 Tax=Streptococcus sp. S784/96/1 TaxID=2653499 RepID=UPI00138685B2|nr:carboxylesterase family protein [Streptococcus sp. S784/96/1]